MNEISLNKLPSLRDALEGGTFAGVLTMPDGTHVAVVLLPERPAQHLSWQDAIAWAEGIGAQLPDRQEQALLFANCRDALPEEWCWSRQEDEEEASYAWFCLFNYGYQNITLKSFEGSAVAVRLIPLATASA